MNISVEYDGHNLNLSFRKIGNDIPSLNGILKRKFWRNEWTLFDKASKEIVALFSIKTKIPFFILDYKLNVFVKVNGSNFDLSLNYEEKKSRIIFKHEGTDYSIIFHRGNRVSLFKSGEQFAAMEKKHIIIAGVQKFVVSSDDNVSLELLTILICVVVITMYQGPEDTDFTVDLGGFFTGELSPFNESWQPKVLQS